MVGGAAFTFGAAPIQHASAAAAAGHPGAQPGKQGAPPRVPGHQAHGPPPPTNAQERLQEMYECGICCDLLVDPVVGLCGHDFCRACLGSWAERRTRGPGAGPSTPLLCPLCRQQFSVSRFDSLGVCVRLRQTLELLFPEKLAARRRELAASQTTWPPASRKRAAPLPLPEEEEEGPRVRRPAPAAAAAATAAAAAAPSPARLDHGLAPLAMAPTILRLGQGSGAPGSLAPSFGGFHCGPGYGPIPPHLGQGPAAFAFAPFAQGPVAAGGVPSAAAAPAAVAPMPRASGTDQGLAGAPHPPNTAIGFGGLAGGALGGSVGGSGGPAGGAFGGSGGAFGGIGSVGPSSATGPGAASAFGLAGFGLPSALGVYTMAPSQPLLVVQASAERPGVPGAVPPAAAAAAGLDSLPYGYGMLGASGGVGGRAGGAFGASALSGAGGVAAIPHTGQGGAPMLGLGFGGWPAADDALALATALGLPPGGVDGVLGLLGPGPGAASCSQPLAGVASMPVAPRPHSRGQGAAAGAAAEVPARPRNTGQGAAGAAAGAAARPRRTRRTQQEHGPGAAAPPSASALHAEGGGVQPLRPDQHLQQQAQLLLLQQQLQQQQQQLQQLQQLQHHQRAGGAMAAQQAGDAAPSAAATVLVAEALATAEQHLRALLGESAPPLLAPLLPLPLPPDALIARLQKQQ